MKSHQPLTSHSCCAKISVHVSALEHFIAYWFFYKGQVCHQVWQQLCLLCARHLQQRNTSSMSGLMCEFFAELQGQWSVRPCSFRAKKVNASEQPTRILVMILSCRSLCVYIAESCSTTVTNFSCVSAPHLIKLLKKRVNSNRIFFSFHRRIVMA